MKKSATHEEVSIKRLQQLAASGDQDAFKSLYHQFYGKLFQFALAIVKFREQAEEIAEDVFIKVWQHKERLVNVQDLRVYLYTATKNTALNYLSKEARASITKPFDNINIELCKAPVTPEELLISTEMLAKLHREAESLPPRCKMIFKLIREDGLRYKEVSAILGISVNTIDAQMAIAVKKIANALHSELDFQLSSLSKAVLVKKKESA